MAIWEQGARRHPIDRALLLFAVARPDLPSSSLAEQPLGLRNAALMALQREQFRSRLPGWLECSVCQERMEFELDPACLPPLPTESPDTVEIDGIQFSIPTSRHLSELARMAEAFPEHSHAVDEQTPSAAIALLKTCAIDATQLPDEQGQLHDLLEKLEAATEAADPWAHIDLAIQCPACGHEDNADFDVAEYLWTEIDNRSQRLLNDVHLLAQAYGWSEAQILALSESRRAAYISRLGTHSRTSRHLAEQVL